jgi:hypothetical protein
VGGSAGGLWVGLRPQGRTGALHPCARARLPRKTPGKAVVCTRVLPPRVAAATTLGVSGRITCIDSRVTEPLLSYPLRQNAGSDDHDRPTHITIHTQVEFHEMSNRTTRRYEEADASKSALRSTWNAHGSWTAVGLSTRVHEALIGAN